MEKIKRSLFAHFLDTDPSKTGGEYNRVAKTTSGTYSLNPQTETEQYIADDTATTTVNGYQPSIDNPLVAHKGDPVFEYVYNIFKTRGIGSACESHVLVVDMFDETSGAYAAQKNDCTIVVNDVGGDAGSNVTVNFDININGDPVLGTATVANGKATFTAAE